MQQQNKTLSPFEQRRAVQHVVLHITAQNSTIMHCTEYYTKIYNSVPCAPASRRPIGMVAFPSLDQYETRTAEAMLGIRIFFKYLARECINYILQCIVHCTAFPHTNVNACKWSAICALDCIFVKRSG